MCTETLSSSVSLSSQRVVVSDVCVIRRHINNNVYLINSPGVFTSTGAQSESSSSSSSSCQRQITSEDVLPSRGERITHPFPVIPPSHNCLFFDVRRKSPFQLHVTHHPETVRNNTTYRTLSVTIHVQPAVEHGCISTLPGDRPYLP